MKSKRGDLAIAVVAVVVMGEGVDGVRKALGVNLWRVEAGQRHLVCVVAELSSQAERPFRYQQRSSLPPM